MSATPKSVGAGSQEFRNVIFRYGLAEAMEDGFIKENIRMSGVPADRVVSTIDLRHFEARLTRRAYRRSPQPSRAPQTS